MTTPAVLGERVLRRLGVEIVPVASRPALATVVSVTSIAARALQGLGVPVAAAGTAIGGNHRDGHHASLLVRYRRLAWL